MASTKLTRTPSAGNNKIYTVSCWVKRTGLGETTAIYNTGDTTANNNGRMLIIDANDQIQVSYYNSGYTYEVTTNRVLRDVNSWYHIVVAFDTTQATSSDRIKIWVNGEQETSFLTSNYPSLDASFNFGSATHYIGDLGGRSIYGAFNVAHLHYIDGTTYDASYFGETDSTTGIWKPKTSPSVSWGSNGAFLKFENSGSMGTDSSGNANNFTVNGTMTQTEDTPSNVFATLNPLLDVNNSPTFSNGNTTATGSSSGTARFTGSNLCVSKGKWYYEVKVTVSSSSPYVGVIDAQSNLRRNGTYFVAAASGVNDSGYAVNMSGDIYHNNSNSYATNIGSISTGDILGFAIDLDSAQRTCEIYKNGTSQRSFNLDEPSSGAYMLACSSTYNEASAKAEVNFGNGYFGTTAVSSAQNPDDGIGIFEYDVPTGYRALCTKSINAEEYS